MNDASKKFDDHLRGVAYRNGRGAALFLAAFCAALWPTDLIVFRHMPEMQSTINWLRIAVIGTSFAVHLVMRTRLGPRYPTLLLGAGGALVMYAVGWGFGEIGGPDRPWIHLAYPALFFSVLAPVRIGARVALVSVLAVALCSGFLVPHPQYWRDPLTTLSLSFVASLVALVVAVGHLSFRIMRQSFYQSVELERASTELADLNETLESRVREQTRDLRRLTDHLERAREDERTRISRELHDQLGQELTALHLALSLSTQRFAKDPKSIAGNLDEMTALLKRTQSTTRNLVAELRPQLLDELGLRAGIEWLIRQTEARAPVRCALAADGALTDLGPDVSTVAFRIVQEALTNVVRHAKAKTVEVRLGVRDAVLELVVSDDGIGLPMDGRPSGFGLIGIRERVATRAGTMELRARAGGGTVLSVTLPFTAPTEEAES
ncbi:MAG TPA: sensor histidine kinase [Polyangia bacterium]|nr:sensor histidine kinase [Polyangia bacterium]